MSGEEYIPEREDSASPATTSDPVATMLGLLSEKLDTLTSHVSDQSTKMAELESRISRTETIQQMDDMIDDRPRSISRGGHRNDRRETVQVQDRKVNIHDLPKSLRDPKIDFEFSGRGDVDVFLQRIEASCAFVGKDYWASYVVRALTGTALSATTAEFPRPLEASWDEVATFLRDRFRHPHYALVQIRELIGCTQKTSAAKFFQAADQKIAQIGLSLGTESPDMDKMIVSILSMGIKPEIYEKLRADAEKFVFPDYSYAQFKLDVIAIDSAIHGMKSLKKGNGDIRIAAVDTDKSSVARRPAYSHPTDYKNDKTCRYCKSESHLAPVCNTLYKKMNQGDTMPADLKQKNAKVLKE